MPKEKMPSSDCGSSTSNPSLTRYEGTLKKRMAIHEVAKEFLCIALAEKCSTETDLLNRDKRIGAAIDAVGGSLNTGDIRTLFYLLEEVACKMINEVAALAQASDPDKAKELIPGLPSQLVSNVKISRADAAKKSFTKRAKNGAEARENNRPQEEKDRKIRVHEKWLEWQQKKSLYNSQGEFSNEMLKIDSDLSHSTIITKWIPEWRRLKNINSSASMATT